MEGGLFQAHLWHHKVDLLTIDSLFDRILVILVFLFPCFRDKTKQFSLLETAIYNTNSTAELHSVPDK